MTRLEVSNRKPTTGEPGTFHYSTKELELYVCANDGNFYPLRGLLNPMPVAGERGERGLPGPRGEVGIAGPCGERGHKGSSGAIGAPGVQGLRGERGDTGATGAQGPKGDRGDIGAQGERGARGEKGERGDVTLVGDADLQAAVVLLKKQKAEFLAALYLSIEEADGPLVRSALMHLKSRANL